MRSPEQAHEALAHARTTLLASGRLVAAVTVDELEGTCRNAMFVARRAGLITMTPVQKGRLVYLCFME
jgi:hypothetical protein